MTDQSIPQGQPEFTDGEIATWVGMTGNIIREQVRVTPEWVYSTLGMFPAEWRYHLYDPQTGKNLILSNPAWSLRHRTEA